MFVHETKRRSDGVLIELVGDRQGTVLQWRVKDTRPEWVKRAEANALDPKELS